MALDTSVNEAKWKLMSQSNRSETTTSAGTLEIVTFTWSVASTEYKYFAITIAAAQSYITANPTLNLTIERADQYGQGCNITKRYETRTLVSVVPSGPPA